jgi:predicted RNA-binding protein with PIN domain
LSRTVVIVDGENVRRSTWPNVGAAELVDRLATWTQVEGLQTVLVFDRHAPAVATPANVELVDSGGESADAWIARRAAELRAEQTSYWLVTSDRALREEASPGAERVIGGGAFLRMVTEE